VAVGPMGAPFAPVNCRLCNGSNGPIGWSSLDAGLYSLLVFPHRNRDRYCAEALPALYTTMASALPTA
ncbi:unnamed protein product, partial [Durusdinium trenchii]